MDDLGRIFGATPPAIPLPLDLEPARQVTARWPWADPLDAILRFGGWTIDDALADREVARSVAMLWGVWKTAGRHAAESSRRALRADRERWRREGLPLPDEPDPAA